MKVRICDFVGDDEKQLEIVCYEICDFIEENCEVLEILKRNFDVLKRTLLTF
jgi:hypothetical protein